jgi:hypothetical protein
MNTSELLQRMRNADFDVSVEGDTLRVLPARWVDDDLADLIRQHKENLMTLLKAEGTL